MSYTMLRIDKGSPRGAQLIYNNTNTNRVITKKFEEHLSTHQHPLSILKSNEIRNNLLDMDNTNSLMFQVLKSKVL